MGNYSATGGRMVSHNMVTTQFELDGYRVVRTLGVVRESRFGRAPSSAASALVCRRWSEATSRC